MGFQYGLPRGLQSLALLVGFVCWLQEQQTTAVYCFKFSFSLRVKERKNKKRYLTLFISN
jgi:hypothetical protein